MDGDDPTGATTPTTWLPDGLTLLEVGLIDSVDAAHAWPYHGIADIDREIAMDLWGYDDLADDPPAILGGMREQTYTTRRRFVVVRSAAPTPAQPAPAPPTRPTVADVVAHLLVELPTTGNTHLAELYVAVRPAWRRRGIGSSLMEFGEHMCRAAGRTTWLTAVDQATEPPPGPSALRPATGAGHVSSDAPETRFLIARGYRLEQVERVSVLTLPIAEDVLDAHEHAVDQAAGAPYRVHTVDEVPERWAAQVGSLFTRMSTDAPLGGLDVHEDPWDAERVHAWSRQTRDMGHGMLMTVAEHVPTASLAAFTLFTYPIDRPAFAYQEDTLVLREHRGRRLGMLVKVANLRALIRERPGTRRVHTWNAEENAHMLAINVALGFVPEGGSAAWQRHAPTSSPSAQSSLPWS